MSTRDLDSPSQPASELPPFVFVPEDGGSTERSEQPIATEPPPAGDPAPRRWGTGHTVAGGSRGGERGARAEPGQGGSQLPESGAHMTDLAARPSLSAYGVEAPPVLDVVVPVHNEEADLAGQHPPAHQTCPPSCRTRSASRSPTTPAPTRRSTSPRLTAELPDVRVVHLPDKGRGRALRDVWSRSDADVLAYMDVDLSTDLNALLPLVASLVSGHSDLAIGTRLQRGSRVVRGAEREVSRAATT